jgi:hypothetical protein
MRAKRIGIAFVGLCVFAWLSSDAWHGWMKRHTLAYASATYLNSIGQAEPELKADDAARIARRFCASIGQPVTATPNVHIEPANLDQQAFYLVRHDVCWTVTFRGQASVEIADATRQVVTYRNYRILLSWALGHGSTPGKAEPEEKAAILFAGVVKASGVNRSELGAPNIYEVQEIQGSSPPVKSGHYWEIDVPRVFHGINYNDQDCVAQIQAESGALLGFDLQFFSLPATIYDVAVTKQMAENVALGVVATRLNHKVPTASCVSAKLLVVRPNSEYQSSGLPVQIPGPAVVAWVCTFSLGPQLLVEVWVNAKDGSIEGGVWQGIPTVIP